MTDSSREQLRAAALVAQYIQELSGGQGGNPSPVEPEPVETPQPHEGA
jgi:hypothetical protein